MGIDLKGIVGIIFMEEIFIHSAAFSKASPWNILWDDS